MLVRLIKGIGAFGKLWTGDKPYDTGKVYNAYFLYKTCKCAATTRKLKAEPVTYCADSSAVDLPVLFVTAGGVGSIVVDTDVNPEGIEVWNWSGRVGGYAILNPLMVHSGYVSKDDLPAPKRGKWIQTYGGNTLSEFVLVDGGGLEVAYIPAVCPKCKREQFESETVLARDEEYVLFRRTYSDGGVRYVAGCRDFTLQEALEHWGDRTDYRAVLFSSVLKEEAEKLI